MPSIVIITPVFEDADVAARLCRDIRQVLGRDVTIVAVDDGSVKNVIEPSAIAQAGLGGVLIRLRRNVGHQRAIAVGLSYVASNLPTATAVVMDSDGEDIPASIPMLLETLAGSDVDVVVAQRQQRTESFLFRVFYEIYRFVFLLLSGRQIRFGNFMALAPTGLKRLAAMPEVWTHVASSVLLSRLRITFRRIDRGTRYAGQSKMNFSALVLHGVRALMVFAEDVLVRVCIVCAAIAATSLMLIAATIILKAIGFATPGWFSVALGILLLVLLQTGALTLMSLMLSGVVRSGIPTQLDYRLLIDEVIVVDRQADV
ncbi:MAG: glycosyltransferase [Mesorhizobium sp.]|nr:glycosyltransferase [Mesorhizobium sp.]